MGRPAASARKPPTKAEQRARLRHLLISTTDKALETVCTLESLRRTTGLPEQEIRVELARERERRNALGRP